MTIAIAHIVCATKEFAARLCRFFREAVVAHQTRRALHDLPDDLLRDLGVGRDEIPFVAGALAAGTGDPTRDPQHRVNRSVTGCVAKSNTVERLLPQPLCTVIVTTSLAILAFVTTLPSVVARDSQINRGKYLVALAGCNDCHTPGYFFGKPDMTRFLGGSEVGFEIPGLGVFHGPNLTPNRESGLGNWSTEEITTAMTTGRRPDGRILAPVMPWHAFANLTPQDASAIVAFLQSLRPIANKVPGPFGPNEKPTSFVMKIMPPEAAVQAGSTPK